MPQSFGQLQLELLPLAGKELARSHWAFLLCHLAVLPFYWALAWALLLLAWRLISGEPVDFGRGGLLVCAVAAGILVLVGMGLYLRRWYREIREGYVQLFESGLRINSLSGFSNKVFSAKLDEIEAIYLGASSRMLDQPKGRLSSVLAAIARCCEPALAMGVRRSALILRRKNGEMQKYPLFTWYYGSESTERFLHEVSVLAHGVEVVVFQ